MLDKTKVSVSKKASPQEAQKPPQNVVIKPPNIQRATVRITGKSPYVMNKMSSEARLKMIENMEGGEKSKKGSKREPKDFNKAYESAMHVSTEGWYGIPASGIRSALISACKIVGFHMTKGKLCLFVDPDGFDRDDGQPLVKINGKPTRRDMAVKLGDGSTSIIARPFFDKWHADVTLSWDADMFDASDVMNLLARVGLQVGIGAGRHDSKDSTGMGWGTFEVEGM